MSSRAPSRLAQAPQPAAAAPEGVASSERYGDLRIIAYPDPRLKKISAAVETFDEGLKRLAERMLGLMREARGVGLAAPQVGINLRLFVMNATGQPADDRIYVNPQLSEADGSEDSEEGCLSLPGITVTVDRGKSVRMQAHDLQGNTIDQVETGYVARIWQHEFDHLNGTMLTDRMGPVARMASRRVLKELEEKYAVEQGKRAKPDKRTK